MEIAVVGIVNGKYYTFEGLSSNLHPLNIFEKKKF